jgi:hypothetical protein
MKKLSEGQFALGSLFVFSFWIFVALPFFHSAPSYSQAVGHAAQHASNIDSTQKPKEPFWERATDDPVAVFTLALVVFTFVLAISTIGLWIVTWLAGRRQARDMQGAIREAARSAEAAQKAVELSDKTAERQLRAYLYVDAQEIRKFGFDEIPEAWTSLKNSGATPAFELERAAKLMYTTHPAEEFPALEWGGAKAYLAPHGEVFFGPISLPRALTAAESANVIAGTHALYLFGKIRYIDAFQKRRLIEFRSFFRGNGQPVGQVLATQQAENGNSGD